MVFLTKKKTANDTELKLLVMDNDKQYSLLKILAIWFCSALPMPILAFVVTPFMIPKINLHPGIVYWMAMIAGLIWQFILSLVILKIDGHEFIWREVCQRLRFTKPEHPLTGNKSYRLLLWTIPFIALSGILQIIRIPDIETMIFPFIKNLPQYNIGDLASPDFKGEWWLLILLIISMLFNYILGEELLYRGILLPKMKGAFGKWDWFANGVLFGLYHLHKPQMFISAALSTGFLFAFPSKKFKSTWMAVIIHGVEGVFIFFLVLGVILGLV